MSYVLEAVEEYSKSRSGKHILRRIILLYIKDKGLIPISKARDRIAGVYEASKTYRRGSAKKYVVKMDHGDYLIDARFVKNFLGKVKGEVRIYNYKGELVYKAKYIDGEVRRSTGSEIYEWLLKIFFEQLKIPVKRWR